MTNTDRSPDSEIRVAVLIGSDALNAMIFRSHEREEPLRGNTNFGSVIEETGLAVTTFDITPNYFRQKLRWKLSNYDLVFNAISDPDRNPKCLDVAVKMEREFGASFLNSPRYLRLLSREKVAEIAATVPGVVAPKTLRLHQLAPSRIERAIAASDLRWPAILRPAGTHQGDDARIVAGADEALASIAPGQSYYLTEFVDYRSKDGYFRKFRFFVIGDTVIVRHLVIGEKWNLHRADRSTPLRGVDFATEERELYETFDGGRWPDIRAMMLEMARKMKLDFMGVDCCVTSPSTIVLFEANPTMNFGGRKPDPARPHKETRRPMAVAAVRKLLFERYARRATTRRDRGRSQGGRIA